VNKKTLGEYVVTIEELSEKSEIVFTVDYLQNEGVTSYNFVLLGKNFKFISLSVAGKFGFNIRNEEIRVAGNKYSKNNRDILWTNCTCFHLMQTLFLLPLIIQFNFESNCIKPMINILSDDMKMIISNSLLIQRNKGCAFSCECLYPVQYYAEYNADKLLDYYINPTSKSEIIRSSR